MSFVAGIDLGTTNSEIAAPHQGRMRVLGPKGQEILPSCVGLSPAGELLVGRAARNQYCLHPERTVRSIKRRMGSAETVRLGDREFTPQEVSALILRELVERASRQLGGPVDRAVITVPAWFSDAQRNATREAGALAGLEVLRILNEPTAASLAYGLGEGRPCTALVYDLGGGTFDVSVVRMEGDVTEVLASHGNNRLGGDDFDELIFQRLAEAFRGRHGLELKEAGPSAEARLRWAAEEAKITLSREPHATVREESLASVGRKALHLQVEISREEYEGWIRPLLEGTLESVSRALGDARLSPSQLDTVLLVGGSTRTPLVSRLLQEKTRLEPRAEVDPDLCVALGAGVLASRLGGGQVDRVLVDVSPFSFGISYFGPMEGRMYPYCYKPIIRRNTPLPVTRTESYWTLVPGQEVVELRVFQGDHPDALQNLEVGRFRLEGLREQDDNNEVLCRMCLDLDGILHVTGVEKDTGLSREVAIADAFQVRDEVELSATRESLEALYETRAREVDEELIRGLGGAEGEPVLGLAATEAPALDSPGPAAPPAGGAGDRVRALVARSHSLFEQMHPDDVQDARDLHDRLQRAEAEGDQEALQSALQDLEDLLFFVESR